MTLLLAAINADYAVLVSDRRLTQSGHALPDEANKTAHLVLNDGRFGVAYTGLATDGSHSTSRWLLEALLEAAAPDALTSQTLERLGQVAERDIGALGRVGTPDGRLSIMLAGFTYPKDEPRAVACLVSNYDSFGRGSNQAASREFTPHYLAERRPRDEGMSLVAFAGAEMAISDRDGQALAPLLKKRRPAHATAVKAFDLVREIAGRPRSSGLIGLQLMAVIVPSDPEVAASSLAAERPSGLCFRESAATPHVPAARGPSSNAATARAGVTADPGSRWEGDDSHVAHTMVRDSSSTPNAPLVDVNPTLSDAHMVGLRSSSKCIRPSVAPST